MSNKLQRTRQKQEPLVPAAVPDTQVVGKLIRHKQTEELESMESKMYETGTSISHINGRISLLYMGYRDLKIWLREIESYLNIDARYSAMEVINEQFGKLWTKVFDLEKSIKELSDKLDDALKEE